MSENEKVTIGKDDGEKNRWGIKKFLYLREGKKTSLNMKLAAILSVVVVVVGTLYSVFSEFFKPTPSENAGPISFNGQVATAAAQSQSLKVPTGQGELEKAKPTKTAGGGVRIKLSGPVVVARPNSGHIPSGAQSRAKFITGASNGLITAALIEPLVFNGEELAESGSLLIGQGSSNDERLMVQFSKLVFKGGGHITIQAQGLDLEDQLLGIKGKKISKYLKMMTSGAALNFLGGLSEGLQESQVSPNGTVTKKSDLKNAALNGASKAALEQSQQLLSELKDQKSTVEIESGKEFIILFDGE